MDSAFKNQILRLIFATLGSPNTETMPDEDIRKDNIQEYLYSINEVLQNLETMNNNIQALNNNLQTVNNNITKFNKDINDMTELSPSGWKFIRNMDSDVTWSYYN